MKLLDQVRQAIRVKHYSLSTEDCYVNWTLRYIRFHGIKHPNTMGTSEVEHFLTHLATVDKVAASTQNQALSALLFLYRDVLKIDIGLLNAVRAKRPARVPVVLTQDEAAQLLNGMAALQTQEPYYLMTQLMYGAGRALCHGLLTVTQYRPQVFQGFIRPSLISGAWHPTSSKKSHASPVVSHWLNHRHPSLWWMQGTRRERYG